MQEPLLCGSLCGVPCRCLSLSEAQRHLPVARQAQPLAVRSLLLALAGPWDGAGTVRPFLSESLLASLCILGSQNYPIWDFTVGKHGIVKPALQLHFEMFLTCANIYRLWTLRHLHGG